MVPSANHPGLAGACSRQMADALATLIGPFLEEILIENRFQNTVLGALMATMMALMGAFVGNLLKNGNGSQSRGSARSRPG